MLASLFLGFILLVVTSGKRVPEVPDEPLDSALCELPKESGPCKALKHRWYYNAEDGECQQFNYGGCRGNGNNFKSLEECQDKCGESMSPVQEPGAEECHQGWPEQHMDQLKASRSPNQMMDIGRNMYEMEVSLGEEGYIPGIPYAVTLRSHMVHKNSSIRGFSVVAIETGGESCGFGSFSDNKIPLVEEFQPDCPNVLVNKYNKQRTKVSAVWTAPDCGCVLIRASVLTPIQQLFLDDEDAISGPLTTVVCPSNDIIEEFPDELSPEEQAMLEALRLEMEVEADESEEDDSSEEIDSEMAEVAEMIEESQVDSDEDDAVDASEENLQPGGSRKYRKMMMKKRKQAMKKANRKNKRMMWKKKKQAQTKDKQMRPVSERPAKAKGRPVGWRKPVKQKMKQHGKPKMKLHHRQQHVPRPMKGMFMMKTEEEKTALICRKVVRNPQGPANRKTLNPANKERITRHRAEITQCCQLDEAERVSCISEVKQQGLNVLCAAQQEKMEDKPQRKRRGMLIMCCDKEDEEQFTCLKNIVTKRQAWRSKMIAMKLHKQKMAMSPEERMNFMCRRLQMPHTAEHIEAKLKHMNMSEEEGERWKEVWTGKQDEARECCELEENTERLTCMKDLKERHFDKMCKGLMPAWPHIQPTLDRCCQLQEEKRYTCMNETMFNKHKMHHRMHHGSRHPNMRPAGGRGRGPSRFGKSDPDSHEVVEPAPMGIHINKQGPYYEVSASMEDDSIEKGRDMEELERELEEEEEEDAIHELMEIDVTDQEDVDMEQEEEEARNTRPRGNFRRRRVNILKKCCSQGEEAGHSVRSENLPAWRTCNSKAKQHGQDSELFRAHCIAKFRKCCNVGVNIEDNDEDDVKDIVPLAEDTPDIEAVRIEARRSN